MPILIILYASAATCSLEYFSAKVADTECVYFWLAKRTESSKSFEIIFDSYFLLLDTLFSSEKTTKNKKVQAFVIRFISVLMMNKKLHNEFSHWIMKKIGLCIS